MPGWTLWTGRGQASAWYVPNVCLLQHCAGLGWGTRGYAQQSGVIIWYLNCSPSLISPPRLAPRYADRKAGEGLLFYSMNDSLLKIPPAVSVPVNKRGHQQYQQRTSLTGQNNDIPSHYTEAKQTAPALQTIEDILTCSQSYSFLHSPLLRKHRVSQSFMCKRGRIADC